MKRRLTMLLCGAALLATAAFSADLGKYNDWPKSPEGYFMTNADRAAWSGLKSEAEADAFVQKFVAARGGPAFEADVAERAKAVNDHLSVGGDIPARTLRGKIIILLGAPNNFTITQRKVKSFTSGANTAMNVSSGDKGIGISPQDIVESQNQSELNSKYVHDYNLTYAKDRLPTHPAKDMVINVEVNPTTGEDRIADTRMARMVNELLESAAEARATTK